jgi:hypothetical protein
MWLYIHQPPIRLHGVVLNYSSTGAALNIFTFTRIVVHEANLFKTNRLIIGKQFTEINYFSQENCVVLACCSNKHINQQG